MIERLLLIRSAAIDRGDWNLAREAERQLRQLGVETTAVVAEERAVPAPPRKRVAKAAK